MEVSIGRNVSGKAGSMEIRWSLTIVGGTGKYVSITGDGEFARITLKNPAE